MTLIQLFIVKDAKLPRHAAEGSHQPELRGDKVHACPEPHLLRKYEALLGLTLHLRERIACREKIQIRALLL